MKDANETPSLRNDLREDLETGIVLILFLGTLGAAMVFGVCC